MRLIIICSSGTELSRSTRIILSIISNAKQVGSPREGLVYQGASSRSSVSSLAVFLLTSLVCFVTLAAFSIKKLSGRLTRKVFGLRVDGLSVF